MRVGKYSYQEEIPPQFRITESLLLKAGSKPLIIENLPQVKSDVQLILAQVMEEREVEVAGMFRKFVRPLFMIGANTALLPGVVDALKNRIMYGVVEEVKNEIDRNKKNERHLITFLRYLCERYDVPPASLDGELEYLDICSRLADEVDKLHISRRTVAIPRYAGRFAMEKGSLLITSEHMRYGEICKIDC